MVFLSFLDNCLEPLPDGADLLNSAVTNGVYGGKFRAGPGWMSWRIGLKTLSIMKRQFLRKDYAKLGDAPLGDFALGCGGSIAGNAIYAGLKNTGAQLKAKAQEFINALSARVGGTSTDTAHKTAVRKALITLMNAIVDEINELAQGNVEILVPSGFHLSNPSTASPVPVGSVAILNLLHPASGKIGFDLSVTGNVWTAILQRQNADGTWTTIGVFTDLNDVVVAGLLPGSNNTFRVCAMAAGNQSSEWSTPIAAICT
jgi:hypothetical protein